MSSQESLNLLHLEHVTDAKRFENFEQLEGTLTKCLLLIAVMTSQALIETKEATAFKKLVMVR